MKSFLVLFTAVFLFFISSCASLEDMRGKLGGGGKTEVPVTYLSNGIFVSVDTGNDTNIGTNRLEPVKSMQTGISNAVSLGLSDIYVAVGVYTPGNGLNDTSNGVYISNNNLYIYGGCDIHFTAQRNGYSEFDCQKLFGPVVRIVNCTNIAIDKVIIRDGMTTNARPSGLYVYSVSNCFIKNTIITNNSNANTSVYAGGITFFYSVFRISNCSVMFNAGYSGGLYSGYSEYNIENSMFSENISYSYGGGIDVATESEGVIKNTIIRNNMASQSGGLNVLNNYHVLLYNNVITNNWTTNMLGTSIRMNWNLNLSEKLFSNVIISNCIIGGTNNSDEYAIYEDGSYAITNHVLIDNIFITNKMGYLYYDFSGMYIISNQNWTNINNKNWTGAVIASGNRVTNM